MAITINKKLLPMKAHYFLFNAGTAPVVPFMPTYARQLGFSSVIVGTIYLILPIVGMVAKPIFGAIADRLQRHKLIFLLFQALTAGGFLCIMFLPPTIPQSTTLDFHCNNGAIDLKYCPSDGEQLHNCNAFDNANEILQCELKCHVSEQRMIDAICDNILNHSNLTQCDRSNGEFNMIANVPMHQIEYIKDCLFFDVHPAYWQLGNHKSLITCLPNPNEPTQPHDIKGHCTGVCNNSLIMEIITNSKIPDDEVKYLYQFWVFFGLLAISWAGMAVVVSVGDAICFEMLGDKFNLYGYQRLWGSIGWGIVAIITGFLVDSFSKGQISKNYTVIFILAFILIGGDILVSSRLNHTQKYISVNILKDVSQLFLSFKIIIFLLWCIVVGFCTAMVWNFLFWYLEDLADASEGCDYRNWQKTIQGLAMGIQCFLGELPFFFLSGWIIKKIGHIHAMSLVLLGFGIRFLLYSILTNPWWVLPIEMMNGITFSIFYATMASYASIVAPPGTEATLQGLVGAIFEGVGVSIGSLVGGILFIKVGGSQTFRYFGIFALIAFLVHVIGQSLLNKYYYGRGRITDDADGQDDRGLVTSQYMPVEALNMLEERDIGPNL